MRASKSIAAVILAIGLVIATNTAASAATVTGTKYCGSQYGTISVSANVTTNYLKAPGEGTYTQYTGNYNPYRESNYTGGGNYGAVNSGIFYFVTPGCTPYG